MNINEENMVKDGVLDLLDSESMSEEELEKLLEDLGLADVDKDDIESIEENWYSDKTAPMDRDSTRMLLREIGAIPLLTPEEEYEYAVRVFTEGDPVAKENLANANYRLVVSIIKRYRWSGIPFLDLFQEGCIGLLNGIDKFNPFKNYKLSTYVTWWIRQAVTRFIADTGRQIRIPVHMCEQINRLKRARKLLIDNLSREPSPDELAEELHITREKVLEMIALESQPVSLETPVGDDDGDSLLGDFIPAKESVEEDYNLEEIKTVVNEALNSMRDYREQLILRMRFGLDGTDKEKTLQECGEFLGITRERVRQIEEKAMRHIRLSSVKNGLQSLMGLNINPRVLIEKMNRGDS